MTYQWTVAGRTTDGVLTNTTPTWAWGTSTELRLRFTPPSVSSRYKALLEYIRSAALATVQVYDTEGLPRYEERIPDGAGVSSLVVAIEPGSGLVDVDAVWALVTGGEDNSVPKRGTRELGLQVVPLALYSEYSDRQAVEDALGSGVTT